MKISKYRSATLGRIVLLGTLAIPFSGALAQDQDEGEPLEEITVTGTALKRVDLDSALPVQVITADTLDRQGITNAADMIEAVPAMQGFFTESDSVGGGGGGIRTANLRAIGSQYTLSLLDGRRMAPAYSGSDIDLSNLPLAAVEQVQILTDGASALYGSDAIAGVVNFILKDSVEETTINARADFPETSGGSHWNFDIVTGFGDIDEDGYSLVASYSHEDQEQLKASERDFAKTGFVFFSYGGQDLYFQNSSANAIPGNAYVYTNGFDDLVRGFNPDGVRNGSCAPQTTPDGETCRFDYTSTLEILPETQRDSITLNGKLKFNENLTGFGTILASQYEMVARIAPYPTGEIPLWSIEQTGPMSDLVATEVWPLLTAAEQAAAERITGTWRALPAGNRTTEYEIDSYNYIFGLEGTTDRFDYTAAVTHATTDLAQSYPTGWLLREEFASAGAAGDFNIFARQEDFTDSDFEALAPAVYSGPWDENNTSMTAFDAQIAMPIFEMGGGDSMLAVGLDYRASSYERKIADANRDEILLFLSKDTAYDLERDQYGIFAEVLFPFADNFESTLSVRYDDISAVEDKLAGTGDIDSGDSDTTYKISGLWNINDAVALRASFGTGFKAPSMREIGEPRSEFGVTSGTFVCPFSNPDPLAAFCRNSATGDQYDVFRQGYAGLKFETSEQYTFGTVLTPLDNLDITIDYWNIELEDLVERLTEQQIFDNPVLYRDLYTTKTNLATGQEFLAIIQAAVNGGTRKQDGIDYAFNYGMELGQGSAQLELSLNGTYIMESESSLTGSSLGRFGNDDGVVFRSVFNIGATLYHGNFTHTLWGNSRNGYWDQTQEVEILGTGVPLGQGPTRNVTLKVDSYSLFNYQLRYMMLDDSLGLTLGITNLLDEEPPLSLRTSGSGHQVGWDPRFVDAFGRTFYLQANYGFSF